MQNEYESCLFYNSMFGAEGFERKMGLRFYKGGAGAAPPPPVAPPRRGDKQAKQVDTVRREQAANRVPGRGATILTKGEDLDKDNVNKKRLTGE